MVAKHIFISHASQDRRLAESMKTGLEANDLLVWIAPDSIPPGASYSESIMDAINNSTAMVAILSAAANVSPHVLREVDRAVHKGISVIPVKTAEFQLSPAMEYLLSPYQWLQASRIAVSDITKNVTDAVGRIQSVAGHPLESRSERPSELYIGISTAGPFDLDVEAVLLSRGRLEWTAKSLQRKYDEKRHRFGAIEVAEAVIENWERSCRILVYPERVSKYPNEDSVRRAVMDCCLALQAMQMTSIGIQPTGRAHDFLGLKAFRATLRGYFDYLGQPTAGPASIVTNVVYSVPHLQDASYEIGMLFQELREAFVSSSENTAGYVKMAEVYVEAPKSLRVTLVKQPDDRQSSEP